MPKGSYPPCLRMADMALLAGYPRYRGWIWHDILNTIRQEDWNLFRLWAHTPPVWSRYVFSSWKEKTISRDIESVLYSDCMKLVKHQVSELQLLIVHLHIYAIYSTGKCHVMKNHKSLHLPVGQFGLISYFNNIIWSIFAANLLDCTSYSRSF